MTKSKRETLGQITGNDPSGAEVIIYVDRDRERIVLSSVSNKRLVRHDVNDAANIEAEAARAFALSNVKFVRVN